MTIALARRAFWLAIAAGFAVHVACVANKAMHSYAPTTPCSDALAAFAAEHWECGSLEYSEDVGLYFKCIGGNLAISEGIADTSDRLTSFLYTNVITGRQGVCDCEKPYGKACESLF